MVVVVHEISHLSSTAHVATSHIPPPLRGPKKKGLSALEALVNALTSGYKIRRALFLVDREHLLNFEAISRWLYSN